MTTERAGERIQADESADHTLDRCSTMIASDLDRTLIYSAAALQLATVGRESLDLICVEIFEGKPLSFMTLAASQRLMQICGKATFVPITTRTVAQYRRIRFPDVLPRFAITSNGGHILVDGVPDEGWHRSTLAAIADCGATLSEVRQELDTRSRDDWAIKRRTGDELFCYLVVDPLRLPDEFIRSWTAWCCDRGWRVSVQGRKIYAIPAPLTKERAVVAVAQRIGAGRILAAGDGALDAGILAAADAGIRPPHGELAALDWRHPTVVVGPRAGVLAADDITSWFAQQLASDVVQDQAVAGDS